MAKVKKEDIKELTTEELVEKVKTEQQNLQRMKFNHTISELDNPAQLREKRRDIARLKTELTARKKAEQNN